MNMMLNLYMRRMKQGQLIIVYRDILLPLNSILIFKSKYKNSNSVIHMDNNRYYSTYINGITIFTNEIAFK